MILDTDIAYHLSRARQEFLFAAQAASIMIAMIHIELGLRHLFHAGLSWARASEAAG